MQRFTREGFKTDPWAGALVSAQEELTVTDGEGGAEMEENHGLRSLAKVTGGVWVSPCRGTSHAQCLSSQSMSPGSHQALTPPPPLPCPCSVQGSIHKQLQLTELKKAKIKLMVQMGRNSIAPIRVFAPAQSVSPPRAKPASSRLGSSEEELQFHVQSKKQHLSKYSSFQAVK